MKCDSIKLSTEFPLCSVLRVMLLSGGKWGLVLLQLALLGLNMQEFFFCAISLKFLSQIKSMILDSMDESLF
jgi:hypothetical protein